MRIERHRLPSERHALIPLAHLNQETAHFGEYQCVVWAKREGLLGFSAKLFECIPVKVGAGERKVSHRAVGGMRNGLPSRL